MNIRPIRTEEDLTWALAEVEPYFLNEPEKGSEEALRFEVLADLIRAYETLHWSVDGIDAATDADQRYVHKGIIYGDLASVRVAIRYTQLAKAGRRSSLMGASSGRFINRPIMRRTRTRRAVKAG